MRKVYTSIILLITMLFGAMTIAQEAQKKYINYQGVARNADGNLMISESLTIGVKLNFGSSESSFEETHDLTTDANGVFSLLIGNGTALAGEYNTLPWGSFATFASVSINGNEIGTTELMAVPHALSSADNQWHTTGNDIENKNGGNVFVTGSLYASQDFSLAEGAAIKEFSTDITLGGNSNEIVPTQKAIKTYVDGQLGGGGGADDQTAAEVAYDNSTSGLAATTTQTAIDELVGSGAVDADADPANEIQTLRFNGATNELSLTDGGSVILPSGAAAVDADSDPTNEIQDISLLGTELTISDGSTIDLAPIVPPGGTDDQNAAEVPYDNSTSGLAATDAQTAIDELATGGLVDTDDQDLSLSGTTLQITDGASVDLSTIIPPGGTDDQNASEVPFDNTGTGLAANDTQAALEELASGGLVDTDDQALILTGDDLTIEDGAGSIDLSAYKDVDVTTKTGILLGDGNAISGLVGTADGQVAKWDAGTSKWKAGTDDTGGGGSSLWSENGGDIYFDSGKVGVGTTSPDTNFEVSGTGTVRHRITSTDASVVNLQWFLPGAANTDWVFATGGSDMQFNYSTSDFSGGKVHTRLEDDGTLAVSKTIQSGDLAGASERNVVADASGNLRIGTGGGSLWTQNGSDINFVGGKVGIGTGTPVSPLDISTTGSKAVNITSTSSNNFIAFNNSSGYAGYAGIWSGDNDMDFGTGAGNNTGKAHLTTKATPRLTATANGNIGIGTTSPTSKLEVNGSIKTSGEINRPSTGNTNMLAIAYGSINANGSIANGSGNFSVSTGALLGYFVITINGESYSHSAFTTVVSAFSAPGFVGHAAAGSGGLAIQTRDTSGAKAQHGFSFVTYKN